MQQLLHRLSEETLENQLPVRLSLTARRRSILSFKVSNVFRVMHTFGTAKRIILKPTDKQ